MQQLPDRNELMNIARSPAGQRLLSLLQSGSRDVLNDIIAQAAAGNMAEAGRKLSEVLNTEEARNLLKQLEKQP